LEPTFSILSITAWMSASLAVGFITIIIRGSSLGLARKGTGTALALGEPLVTSGGGLWPSA